MFAFHMVVNFATCFTSPVDWLVDDVSSTAQASLNANITPFNQADTYTLLSLSNGLLTREFAVGYGKAAGGFGTWDIRTHSHGSALRAFSPEAIITLDSTTYYIGGLVPIHPDGTVCPEPSGVGPPGSCAVAYLNRSQLYSPNTSAFMYTGHKTSSPVAPFPWVPGSRHTRNDTNWPPKVG